MTKLFRNVPLWLKEWSSILIGVITAVIAMNTIYSDLKRADTLLEIGLKEVQDRELDLIKRLDKEDEELEALREGLYTNRMDAQKELHELQLRIAIAELQGGKK